MQGFLVVGEPQRKRSQAVAGTQIIIVFCQGHRAFLSTEHVCILKDVFIKEIGVSVLGDFQNLLQIDVLALPEAEVAFMWVAEASGEYQRYCDKHESCVFHHCVRSELNGS